MRIVTLIFALALFCSTAQAESTTFQQHEVDIYSALINHGLGTRVPIVVLSEQTTGDPAAIAEHEDTAALVNELGAPATALRSWQRRNASRHAIESPLKLDVSYQMLDAEMRAELFDGVEPAAGWGRFFAHFEGAPGLLRVSRAGFDDVLKHALVYAEFQCGINCGSGRLIHLINDTGKTWQVSNAAVVWMVE